MSPLWGHATGILIVVMMLCFIGAWLWLWDHRHLPTFDALARLPLEDEPLEDEPPEDQPPDHQAQASQSPHGQPRQSREAP
jgi:cytochrome c oxidase cbb3-type subunit 4